MRASEYILSIKIREYIQFGRRKNIFIGNQSKQKDSENRCYRKLTLTFWCECETKSDILLFAHTNTMCTSSPIHNQIDNNNDDIEILKKNTNRVNVYWE